MKLKNWIKVMLNTKTIEGPFLYFQTAYFLHTFFTVLSRLKVPKIKSLKAYTERRLDKEIVIKNSLGIFSVNPKNDSLTKSITSFEYTHQEWLGVNKRKKIFIDIGTNIGFYSILAINKFGFKKAYAFEPNPETFQRLSKNIELNQLSEQIVPLEYGLSELEETALLGTKAVHTGASSFVNSGKNNFETVRVQTKPFNLFISENNISIEDIDFIKIDVEGYEYQVLKGMSEALNQFEIGTCIFIEIHPHSIHTAQTTKMLTDSGFVCIKDTPQHNFLYIKK